MRLTTPRPPRRTTAAGVDGDHAVGEPHWRESLAIAGVGGAGRPGTP